MAGQASARAGGGGRFGCLRHSRVAPPVPAALIPPQALPAVRARARDSLAPPGNQHFERRSTAPRAVGLSRHFPRGPPMTPAVEYLRQGQLSQCLEALQAQVRQQPADPKLRVFLFQLLAVLGRWDRALAQLKVAGEMDPTCIPLTQIYQPALHPDVLRAE